MLGTLRKAVAVAAMVGCLPAFAQTTPPPPPPQNQTDTTTPVSLNADVLPYTITLTRAAVGPVLPTLQGFAAGQTNGLWVILGGRTNGLHDFTSEPLQNFPPAEQNRRIYVIDPATWQVWSRPISDSALTKRQQDELGAGLQEVLQVGERLYVVGGYGYSRDLRDFTTFEAMSAFDLPTLVAWVRRAPSGPGAQDLSRIVRQTRSKTLQVTGGQLQLVGGRAVLAFGQRFLGGYGSPDAKQAYINQVRSFDIVDDGRTLAIRDVRSSPAQQEPGKYRRRDYNMVPILALQDGKRVQAAVALSGVFTPTGGIWTVPVEIDKEGVPTMADPRAKDTFKQAMNGYNTANLSMFDTRTNHNHAILFGGISYGAYLPEKGFVFGKSVPFINNSTAIVRRPDGFYRQFLLPTAEFPKVLDESGKRLRFGAEATVFLDPSVPVLGNGMIDLRKALAGGPRVIGRIYGGIVSDKPNFGNTAGSNAVFDITLSPN